MKREWYDDSFNKDKMEQEDRKWTPISKVYQSYTSKRSKFWMNVVEFVVGLILLGVCWWYLSNHPAERISLFSWVEVFIEKAKLSFSNEGSWEDLERRNQLLTLYSELLDIGTWSECLTNEDVESIQTTKDLIESKSIEEFVQREQSYNAIARIFMSKVSRGCD